MKNGKIYLLVLMLLICILSISAISATENTANKDVISADNNKETNLETNIQYDDVSNRKENVELNLEENKNNNKEGQSQTDETTTETNAELSFTNLNTTINGNTNSTIYLSNNYKYNSATDYNFELKGIQISRNLTIYGNGVTLNGNNMSRMFNVTDSNLNVNFYNINFINGHSYNGGAIYGGNSYYCNFTDNSADSHGGAILLGNAYNCTFTQNIAGGGGAIYTGKAFNCTFTQNLARSYGGAIMRVNATNCIFAGNNARTSGGAMYEENAYNCTFTQNNATYGGAIIMGNAYNCTFTENNASQGGAIYRAGNAINCTFRGNNATEYGGAMTGGSAILCRFNGDTTSATTTIFPSRINVLNYTSTYGSGKKLEFNLTANHMWFDGFNTTIEIYQNGTLVKNVYGLTGEGWIVDLDYGNYTAVLKLTDYPDEPSSNVTITIKDSLTFTELNTIINGNTNSTIYLSGNFKFDSSLDNDFKNGIPISRNLTIYGNGATIDGNNIARIFNVTDPNLNVNFYDINFINGNTLDEGGAIYQGNAYNCTFTGNNAENKGGSIYNGNAYNCTFTKNKAFEGGAIYLGTATDCEFIKNEAATGGAICRGNATNSIFTENKASAYGGAIQFGNANGSIFKNNKAERYSGALHHGNAYNCTFTNNTAKFAGAINGGNATNCTFTNNNATNGGAMHEGNATNCTFTNNKAIDDGGAMYYGNAYNSTFTGNTATNGGAIYGTYAFNSTFHDNNATENGGGMCNGTSLFCTFNGDTTYNSTIIPAIINVSNYSSSYGSGKKLEFNLTANGTVYNGFNTTIEIYQNGTLLKTVYALTGEGWTVDLDYGNYTAVLKLTDYPDEPSSNVTITIKDSLTFTDLNTTINNNTNSTIYLSNNYTYDNTSDNNFKSGIPISRNLTIYGNGITVDGNNLARIFNVTDPNLNVKFYNINFINGNSENGGAIYQGDAYNCNFTGNTATEYGGAIYQGDAYNCTFTQNNASYGGAIWSGNASNCTFTENKALYEGGALIGNAFYCTFTQNNGNNGGAICRGRAYNSTFTENNGTNGGAVSIGETYDCTFIGNNANNGGALHEVNAYNCTFKNNTATTGQAMYEGNSLFCTFNGDTTYNTTIIPAIINVSNYSSTYESGKKLEFNLTANGTLYNGFNTTIDIYQNGTLLKTVYGLTGQGWTVDLDYGTYTAVLSLTEYPDEPSSNATIAIKEEPIIVITPITNATIGEEITINYTTNSTGAVTIKVNGQAITGNKFTPEKPGTYNITVEIAETDYYAGATNETTFTIPKTNTTVEIGPITNVTFGQEVKINITTNSNGTVTIKVNGQVISGTKFTPTIPGTYNLTVEIAETDYYAGATNETTFNVSKANTTVIMKPIGDVPIGEEMKINYTTNSNGTVTIKVNNQTITGNKFTPQTVGIYNLTVEIAANDYYTGATYETTFKAVEEIATKITAKPVTTTYYMSKIFTITLKDANGKPISGAVLTVNLDGTKKYKTNKYGQVKIQVGALTPKTYNVKITYAGSKKYKATTTSVKIPIKKATPKITAYTVKYNGKNKQFKVYFLTDHMKYHALKNKEVTLKVNGKTYKVKTNKKGQGIFNINHLKKGKYTAVLTVPANQYYNKVTKKVIITVKK